MLDPEWEFVADTVMGGVSTGQITRITSDERMATRLTGEVSLENNGGFIQMAADLPQDHGAAAHEGIEIMIRGNGATYDLRLRTTALTRPWQSYRAPIQAPQDWTRIRVPFAALKANKTDAPFDPAELRRLGIVAVGRAFEVDVWVAEIGFY